MMTQRDVRVVKARISRKVNPLKRQIAQLTAKINDLREIGAQMANVCYNLGQRPSVSQEQWEEWRPTFKHLQEQWDAAARDSLPKSL